MMGDYNFASIATDRLTPILVENTWEVGRIVLQKDYATADVKMPEVTAYLLTDENYDETMLKFHADPDIPYTLEEKTYACVIPCDIKHVPHTILIRLSSRNIYGKLWHEMLHLWECYLDVKKESIAHK